MQSVTNRMSFYRTVEDYEDDRKGGKLYVMTQEKHRGMELVVAWINY